MLVLIVSCVAARPASTVRTSATPSTAQGQRAAMPTHALVMNSPILDIRGFAPTCSASAIARASNCREGRGRPKIGSEAPVKARRRVAASHFGRALCVSGAAFERRNIRDSPRFRGEHRGRNPCGADGGDADRGRAGTPEAADRGHALRDACAAASGSGRSSRSRRRGSSAWKGPASSARPRRSS